jgi:hypothetical protein
MMNQMGPKALECLRQICVAAMTWALVADWRSCAPSRPLWPIGRHHPSARITTPIGLSGAFDATATQSAGESRVRHVARIDTTSARDIGPRFRGAVARRGRPTLARRAPDLDQPRKPRRPRVALSLVATRRNDGRPVAQRWPAGGGTRQPGLAAGPMPAALSDAVYSKPFLKISPCTTGSKLTRLDASPPNAPVRPTAWVPCNTWARPSVLAWLR